MDQILQTVARAMIVCSILALGSCSRLERSVTRNLELEKSYTRRAMEYHREHPERRRGDEVLETWSTADYIAVALEQQKLPGEWARQSTELPFLEDRLKNDSAGRPFCVIQTAGRIIVLRVLGSTPFVCRLEATNELEISSIRSGDMQFSGRTDFWTYVLDRTDLGKK